MTHPEYAPPSPDLERELDESRRWCQSEGREGRSAYLAFEEHVGMDLREAPLASAMLQETNLAHSCLDGADLSFATANGASFAGASLVEANFSKAHLVGADFSGASAPRARFRKANLSGARFDHASLADADLTGATALDVSFRGADLRGVRLPAALDGAALDDARLDSSTTFDPGFDETTVRAERIDFDGQVVEGAALREVLGRLRRTGAESS